MSKTIIFTIMFLEWCIAQNELNQCLNNILKMDKNSNFVYLIKEKHYLIEMPSTKTVFLADFESETNPKVPVRPDFYLIQISSVDKMRQLENFLSEIYFDYNWNSYAKVLIITKNSVSTLMLFELTWKFYFREVVILLENMKLFTYFPISRGNCSAYSGEYLGKSSDLLTINVVKDQPSTFEGCIIRTPAIILPPFTMNQKSKEYPGVFQQVANLFSNLMKYKHMMVGNHSNIGSVLPNGTFTLYYGDLKDGKIDFINGNIAYPEYLKYLEIIPMYIYHDFKLWAPIAKKADVWLNLAMVFSWVIWILIMISFFAVTCCWYALSRVDRGHFRSFSYSMLSVWRSAFGDCGSTPHSNRLKLLTFFWTLATFILCSAFQSYITFVMFVPRYNKQINSIEKLIDSKLPIGGRGFHWEFLKDQNTKISKKLLENYHICSLSMECVVRAARQRDMVALRDTRTVMYIWPTLLDDGKPMLYWFYNEIKMQATVQMRKGHPLKDKLRLYMMMCMQNSLFMKWDLYNIPPKMVVERNKYEHIILSHLLIAFLLLVVGIFVASTRFLYELTLAAHAP